MASGSLGGYSFSGEFCLDASCQGGPNGTTARLTNASLSCSNPGDSGSCGPVDIRFEADSFNFTQGLVELSLSGFGSASGYAAVCLESESNICASDLTGSQSVFIHFDGLIAGESMPLSFNNGGLGFNVLGGFHLDGLAGRTLVSLPDSFAISVIPITGSSQTPEPLTGLLLGFGLVSLIVLRKAFGNSTPS